MLRPSSLADRFVTVLMVGLISFFVKKSYDYLHFRKRRYDLPLSLCLLLECVAFIIVALNLNWDTPLPNQFALVLAVLATSGVVYFSYKNRNE